MELNFLDDLAIKLKEENTESILQMVKNGTTYKEYTVLMLAGMINGGTKAVKEIVKKFPDELNKKSTSMLDELLGDLEMEADSDLHTDSGFTPVMLAIMLGPPSTVKVLIDAGADLDVKSKNGRTAMDIVIQRNDFQIWRSW
eukprot:CAMPEP_0184489396 /NCGR_PEP_ID=MMETSP0113_2-20130426/15262_1 /TAXON_ID=91329 /ORGANISM="Norrisiella sphaerica, Strain BC52" /LENGTH=141 /DNA_ID=CAMNT_0026872775 /DNA_START=138 /DNA_END=560 /DNA_ORIENTATION=-